MYKQLRFLTTMLLLAVCVGTWADQIEFDFEDESAHRTEGNNSYTSNTYQENGVNISLTYADAVTSGSPLVGSANVMGRIAKNTTNSPVILIGPINNTGNKITTLYYTIKGVAAMKMVAEYSNDNSTWHTLQTTSSMPTTKTVKTVSNLSITDNTIYLRFTVSVTSSTSSNRDFQLDDIILNYEPNSTPSLTPNDLALTDSPIALSFDLYSNASAQTISYTTSSTGAVSVAQSDYATFAVDQTNKTITVTPTAVTNGAQTITVIQAADETYAAGSATFTVTITDSSPVADYVTLPFTWEGGASSALTALQGISASGLGSDYAASNAPYLIKLDDTGDYIQFKTNETPGKVTIGVKMIGGATASKITVQGSDDGETFTDVQELTISGSQNDVLELEMTNSFAATNRYVRLLFTKGSNVGVGPISIEKAAAQQTLTVAATNGTIEIAGQELENNTCNISQGASVTATATPNEHYIFTSWTVNGVTLEDNTANPLTFTMPANAVTLTANFTLKETHTATFYANGVQVGEAITVYEGEDINFPSVNDIEGYSVVGWLTSTFDGITPTAPTGMVTSATMGTENITYHAVLAIKTATDQTLDETQTLKYDTWTYSGTTTDKTTYRLFGEGSYIESEAFDLSNLTKVVVYGGTFGGGSYNSITIKDENNNIWKNVTVSGSSQTGTNTYTEGTALTGTAKLCIMSNSGDGSNSGIRISKVEIFTSEPIYAYADYCTTIPVPSIIVTPTAISADAAGETANVTVTYEYVDLDEAAVEFYTSSEATATTTCNWIHPTLDANKNVELVIDANSGAARNAYMKVYSMDNETNLVYSEVITINQEAAPSLTINIASACTDGNNNYYGTFYSDKAYVMNDMLEGQVVSVDADGKLVVETAYNSGDVVPANTALLIYAVEPGSYNVYTTTAAGEDWSEYNMLKGTLTADEMTTGDNCLFYRLTMHNGTQIGFWWGAADGAAFKPGANKAYLAVPAEQAKAGFAFEGGDATSISTIDNGQLTMENAYNLQGQKVGSAYKGIVIVNGKKVMVK